MSLVAACPCGARFQARPDLAGKMVKCPKCGQPFQVPHAMQPPTPAQQPAGFGASDPLGSFPAAPAGHMPQGGTLRPPRPAAPRPAMGTAKPRSKPKASSKIWLFVGLGVGGVAVLGIIGVVVAVAVVRPAVQQARQAALRAQSQQASQSPLANATGQLPWQVFTSPDGGYSIDMPGHPRPQTRMQPTPAGLVTLRGNGVEGPNWAYLASYSDLPAPALRTQGPDQMLDESCRQIAANGQLDSLTSVTVDGFPGRDVRFRGETGGRRFQSQTRLVLVGNRLYTVVWIGDVDLQPPADVRRFVDSFKISYRPAEAAEGTDTDSIPVADDTSHPFGDSASVDSAPSGDEARRRLLYRTIARFDAMTEADPRVEMMKRRGMAGGATNLENIYERNREVALQALATQHNTTVEELKAIREEGESKGWPK